MVAEYLYRRMSGSTAGSVVSVVTVCGAQISNLLCFGWTAILNLLYFFFLLNVRQIAFITSLLVCFSCTANKHKKKLSSGASSDC